MDIDYKDHDKLRELLLEHIQEDDASHQKLYEAFRAHIAAESPEDPDHRIIATRLAMHVELVNDSHGRLLAAFDRHVARKEEI